MCAWTSPGALRQVGEGKPGEHRTRVVEHRPAALLSCDIHAHTPAKQSSKKCLLYTFLLQQLTQTVLGMGMGM